MNFTSFHRLFSNLSPGFRRQISELPLVALSPLWPLRWSWKNKLPAGERVVLFVHGYGGYPGHFRPMRSYFHWMGRKHTYSMRFQDMSSLETMALELQKTILDIAAFHTSSQANPIIDLVGHSMGGIIARLALEDPTIACKVASLITLATPHHGTQLARYINTARTKALSPQSDILSRLECQLPWKNNPLPPLISFWTASDLVLLPPESALVEGAENIEIKDFSHFSFLIHPQGWQMVFAALQDEN